MKTRCKCSSGVEEERRSVSLMGSFIFRLVHYSTTPLLLWLAFTCGSGEVLS
jgi:hypothetical protein